MGRKESLQRLSEKIKKRGKLAEKQSEKIRRAAAGAERAKKQAQD